MHKMAQATSDTSDKRRQSGTAGTEKTQDRQVERVLGLVHGALEGPRVAVLLCFHPKLASLVGFHTLGKLIGWLPHQQVMNLMGFVFASYSMVTTAPKHGRPALGNVPCFFCTL